MSGRERERERDRRSAAAAARTNEYFVPKDGIDREVITADICRYLGNDALVRPGSYDDPNTRQVRQGYFITAYRNLTTAMIADLKADSERWENERRATATRGPSNVGYRDSTTHQSRQYYGPTEPQAGATQGYPPGTPTGGQQVYDSGPSYQQSGYSQPAGPGYAQPGYPIPSDNYYVAGADMNVEQPRTRVAAGQSGINVPRTNVSNVQYPGSNAYQQPDNRAYYPAQAGPAVSSAQYPSQQPPDPYYGRAAPPTDNMYPAQDTYDNRSNYQESASYAPAQPSMTQSAPAVPNTGTRRMEQRDRESEPRERHTHRSGRRN